ncbi:MULTISPECIES: hypothetical protein [Brasilonema]|nr:MULTISPECIES: hypothetical protein [Brasilonema]
MVTQTATMQKIGFWFSHTWNKFIHLWVDYEWLESSNIFDT